MNEVWKDIEEFEGYYQISNIGEVKSLERIVKNGLNSTRIVKERILKQTMGTNGYLSVGLHKHQKCKKYEIHRLVAIAFISNPDNKSQVNHKDGIKTNNFDFNFEWVTHKENADHAVLNNLVNNKGSNHGNAKLVEEDIVEIRELYKSKSQRAIAEMYNVNRATIGLIVTFKTWKHVGGLI